MRQANQEEKLLDKEIEYFDMMANTRRLQKYNSTYMPWDIRTTMNQHFVDKINRPLYEKFIRERPSYMKGLPNKYGIKMPGDTQLTSEEFDKTKSMSSASFERHRLEYNMSLKELRQLRPDHYDQWIPKHMRRIRKFMRKKNETRANSTHVNDLTHMGIHQNNETDKYTQTTHGERERRQIVTNQLSGPNLIIYPKKYFDYLTFKLAQVINDVIELKMRDCVNINEPSDIYEQYVGSFDDDDDASFEENEEQFNENNFEINKNELSSQTLELNEISETSDNSPHREQKILIFLKDKSENDTQEDGVNTTSSSLVSNESVEYSTELIKVNNAQDRFEIIAYLKQLVNHNPRCKRQVILMGNGTNERLAQMGNGLANDMGENEVVQWNTNQVRDFLRARIKYHEQELIYNSSLNFMANFKKLKEEEERKTQNKTDEATGKQPKQKRILLDSGAKKHLTNNVVPDEPAMHRIRTRCLFNVSSEDNRATQNNDISEERDWLHRVEKTAEIAHEKINMDSSQHKLDSNINESIEENRVNRFKRDIGQPGYNKAHFDVFQRVKGRRESLRQSRKNLTEERLTDLMNAMNKTFHGAKNHEAKNNSTVTKKSRDIFDILNMRLNKEKEQTLNNLNTEERKYAQLAEDISELAENPLFHVTIKRRKRFAPYLKNAKNLILEDHSMIHKVYNHFEQHVESLRKMKHHNVLHYPILSRGQHFKKVSK